MIVVLKLLLWAGPQSVEGAHSHFGSNWDAGKCDTPIGWDIGLDCMSFEFHIGFLIGRIGLYKWLKEILM